MEKIKFYKLVENEDGACLELYNENDELVVDYLNLNSNKINDYIANLECTNDFFITWAEEKKDKIVIDEILLNYLLESENFVNKNFEKIFLKEVETATLLIRNDKNIEDKLDIFLEINDNILTTRNIIGNYAYVQGSIYKIDFSLNENFSIKDLFQDIDKYELETYCNLILKNYKNLELKY